MSRRPSRVSSYERRREREKLVQQHTTPFVPRLEPLAVRGDSDKLSGEQMVADAAAEESEEHDDESERESEAEPPDAAGPLID